VSPRADRAPNGAGADALEIGLCALPEDPRTIVRWAQLGEQAGVGWLGICDSPLTYADPHATIQEVLRSTTTLRAGTLVTNPVTRHWSVQAGAFRTLEGLAPGRTFMGIGTGDTAVLEVGLRPARIAELASYVARFREYAPTTHVLVAVGGPRSARRAAGYADALVLGDGATPAAVGELLRSVAPVPSWLFLIMSLVARAEDEDIARNDVRDTVFGQAGQAADGGVDAATERSLLERFAVIGAPEAAAEKINRLVDETGIRRVFLAVISAEPDRVVELATSRMLPRLFASAGQVSRGSGGVSPRLS